MEIERLESRLSRHPSSPLFARLAAEYLNMDRIQEAKELCSNGLHKYPDYSTAYLILAKCFEKEENYPSALDNLRIAKSLNPTSKILAELDEKIEQLLNPITEEEIEIPLSEATSEPGEEIEQILDTTGSEAVVESPAIKPVEITSTTPIQIDIAKQEQPETMVHTTLEEITAPQVETVSSEVSTEIIQHTIEVKDEAIIADSVIEAPATHQEILTTPSDEPDKVTQDVIEYHQPTEVITETHLEEKPIYAIPEDEKEQAQTQMFLQEFNDDGRIVSKTLAEIYAAQGEYEEAILTYQLLKQSRPNQADEIEKRIGELEHKLRIRTNQQ